MHRGLCLMLLLVPGLAEAQEPLRKIAFGSCVHQDKPQPIWEPIAAVQPDLFLLIGDNIYGDTEDMQVLRDKYAKLGNQSGYQRIRKMCPLLAIWDDHDFGVNDGGAEYPKKKESQRVFLEFFQEPKDSPRWNREGLYHAYSFGPEDKRVQVILTDTRYFRGPLKKRLKFLPSQGPYDPSGDTTSTMLGDAQWNWLEEQLKVPARVRLLISTIQVVAEDHHHEKWMNLPHERERLFQLLRKTAAAGVIVLSGDRHLAELSMMDAGIGYPLFDLTSSGLNQGFPRWRKLEPNRHRVATMDHGNNFGLITIDWTPSDPLLSLQIRDETGDIVLQQKLPLSVLQPGSLKGKGPAKQVLVNGAPFTPELLKKLLNQKITLEMVVQATGASKTGDLVFLNSHDRVSDDNFTVVLDKKAQAGLKALGVANPRTHFEGKAIRVTGELTLFRERPQIMVSDAAQIELRQ